jgi:formylglycine-generating enzyme required for sulfatase activity
MGWQCRAPWLTLLVVLWLVTQGALPLAGAPESPRRVDDPEAEMWGLARDSLHPADVAAFLQAYPNGKYAPAARLTLKQLKRPQIGPPLQVGPHTSADAALPEPLSTLRNSLGIEFVLIPAGEFMMGSDSSRPEEMPVH